MEPNPNLGGAAWSSNWPRCRASYPQNSRALRSTWETSDYSIKPQRTTVRQHPPSNSSRQRSWLRRKQPGWLALSLLLSLDIRIPMLLPLLRLVYVISVFCNRILSLFLPLPVPPLYYCHCLLISIHVSVCYCHCFCHCLRLTMLLSLFLPLPAPPLYHYH